MRSPRLPAGETRRRDFRILPLEARWHLHASVDLSFSFQPKRNPVPDGMIADVGEAYGDRGDGHAFGWNADNSRNMRDRNRSRVQRFDTLAPLQVGGNFAWELALPNGEYRVTVWAGDLAYPDGSQVIRAEDASAIKGPTHAATPVLSKTTRVAVTDGRLTLRTAKGARDAKLIAVRVQSSHAAEVDDSARVRAEAIDASATEGGDRGTIRLTRSDGDLARPLTVRLAWSGSAGPKDVAGRPTSTSFSAGQTVIDLPVVARVDATDEPDETAKLAIVRGDAYEIDGTGAAAVIVLDATTTPDVGTPQTRLAWSSTTSALTPHTEAQSAVIDGKFYRFGGYNGNYSATRRVERFDLAKQTWARMNDMPIGLTHAATAAVNDHEVWFAGAYAERIGSPGQQDIAVRHVWIYDANTDAWRPGPSLPAPRGSGGLAYVQSGGKRRLYFISGERAGDRANVADAWQYDLDRPGDGWTNRAPIPQGRSHFGTVVVNGMIYVFGGQVNHDAASAMLDTTYVYDPAADRWSRRADMPAPMSHLAPASVAHDGRIYSFSGDYPVYVASRQVREYDPATDAWRLLTDLPVPRAAVVAGAIGDRFIVSGGKDVAEWSTDTFIGTFA